MAQTKKRRRRKHRGTQAGTIDRAGRTHAARGRPQSRADAKQTAQERREARLNTPPTWRSSLNRAAIAAAVFGLLVIFAFGQKPIAGVTLAAFMLLLYVPMSYYTDRLLYNRRQRQKQRNR